MAFPALVLDAANSEWSGVDVFPTWVGFQARGGLYASRDQRAPSAGNVTVSVLLDESSGAAPSTAQDAAYSFLRANERVVTEAVVAAICGFYPLRKHAYERFAARFPEQSLPDLPDLTGPMDLRAMIGLNTIHVLTDEKDGVAYIGFELGCIWDEEHGLGVLTHQQEIVAIGDAEVAFLGP